MPMLNFVIHTWKNTWEEKKVGENNIYELHCRYFYLLLTVMLHATMVLVFASFFFTFNDGKEMHVHATFTRETACCCHWLTCFMFCKTAVFHSSVQDNEHEQHLKCIQFLCVWGVFCIIYVVCVSINWYQQRDLKFHREILCIPSHLLALSIFTEFQLYITAVWGHL